MDNVATFLQTIADTVPFVLDIIPSMEDIRLTVHLQCLEGLEVRQVYDVLIFDRMPHAVICDDLTRMIEHHLDEKHAATWQQMKTLPDSGIALCRMGEWSMQHQIAWPPPPFEEVYLPGSARIQHRLMLRKRYDLTRVALYQG